MKMSVARVALVTSAVLLVIVGCSKKGNGPVQPKPFNEARLEFFSAQPLAGGFSYELWAKPPDSSLSAAADWIRLTRFNFNSSDDLLDSNGAVVSDRIVRNLPLDLDSVESLEVTIEQTSQHATVPSQTIYLRGRVPPNLDSVEIAELKFSDSSVNTAQGYCLLATPTDADTTDELSGVWFEMAQPPGPADSGLWIPPAPVGWLYAGWVSHHGVWLPTGKFRRTKGADLTNPYCSSEFSPPDYPGEDFLKNAPSGIGFTFPFALTIGDVVMVTLQPDPDPGTGPFGVVVLTTQFSSEPSPGSPITMYTASGTVPSGSVDIKRAGSY